MNLLPETANITPEAAAARRAQSKAAIVEMLSDVPPPYAIGISGQIKQASNLPVQHINRALRDIVSSRRYLKATAEAGRRTGLDGKESELLEKHKQRARDRLANSSSKPSEGEKATIAPVETPAESSQRPVEPAGTIQPKRRRILSLKRGAA